MHGLGVALAQHGDPRRGGGDRSEVVGGEVDVGGAEVLVESFEGMGTICGFRASSQAGAIRWSEVEQVSRRSGDQPAG
jgi:hypothetical protein